MIEINKVYQGPCENYLNQIDNNSIDLICIDPPYLIHYLNNPWDSGNLDWSSIFKEYERILKETGNLIIFQGYSNVCETIKVGKNYFDLKNWIIYDRIKGRGATRNVMSTREDILWFTKINSNNYTYNKIYSNTIKRTRGMGSKNNEDTRAITNVWSDISPIVPWSSERVNHPTQKPIQLIYRILRLFSNDNDLVLDSFAGSGTVGEACFKMKRNFILIEKDKRYCEIIDKRLNKLRET